MSSRARRLEIIAPIAAFEPTAGIHRPPVSAPGGGGGR